MDFHFCLDLLSRVVLLEVTKFAQWAGLRDLDQEKEPGIVSRALSHFA